MKYLALVAVLMAGSAGAFSATCFEVKWDNEGAVTAGAIRPPIFSVTSIGEAKWHISFCDVCREPGQCRIQILETKWKVAYMGSLIGDVEYGSYAECKADCDEENKPRRRTRTVYELERFDWFLEARRKQCYPEKIATKWRIVCQKCLKQRKVK